MTRRGGPGKAPRQIAAAKWDRSDRSAGIEEARVCTEAVARVLSHDLLVGAAIDTATAEWSVVMLDRAAVWLELAAVAA